MNAEERTPEWTAREDAKAILAWWQNRSANQRISPHEVCAITLAEFHLADHPADFDRPIDAGKFTSNADECECRNWGAELMLSGHHISCPRFDPKPFILAIHDLLRGMREWASDEDGIHPNAWEAYQKAAVLVGIPLANEAKGE